MLTWMLRMKNSFNLANGIILLVASCEFVGGNECTQGRVAGHPDVNLCEKGTHVITGAYLSASSDQMGGGTRCTCTLVALSPQSNSSLFVLNQSPRVSNCSAVVTLRGSSRAQYTCQSSAANTHVTMNASDVIIEVLRNGSADFGFCVIMIDSNLNPNNRYNLTCESDAFFNGTTTSPATGETTRTHTSTLTSSASPTSSSDIAVSSESFTSAFPPFTTSNSAVQTSTLLPTSTSASSTSPAGTAAFTEDGSRTCVPGPTPEWPGESQSAFPIAAVLAGLSGAINIALLAAVVVLCCRLRRKQGGTGTRETGEDDSHYVGLSDVTRVNLRADPNYDVIGANATAAV